MDEKDGGAVGSSELADVSGRSEIDPRSLHEIIMTNSIFGHAPALYEGSCPYLQAAAQAQRILKIDRAQVSSIGCSQRSTMQDNVAPTGPSSCNDSPRS